MNIGVINLICRMSKLEENYSKKVENVKEKTAQEAAEKEKRLQDEVAKYVR